MQLVSAYSYDGITHLYELLKERTSDQSISHKEMPTMDEHIKFVESLPYPHWYLIIDEDVVGAIYLTDEREIGIAVFKKHRGNGYATEAIDELKKLHPGNFLANINPLNEPSMNLFMKTGFKHIQNTLIHES